MKKRILTATLLAAFSIAFLFPAFATDAQAADKLGWIGPVYKELSDSLMKGFKEYYKKTYGKDVDITFVRPGGWPVCIDKLRAWGNKPDADIFLGAGAPAHEVLKNEGRLVPYKPKDWNMVPANWQGMKVKDDTGAWTCFAPWIVTNLYNEKVLKALKLPPPKTWKDLLNPIYRGNIVHTLPYASGTQHEVVEILMQGFGEKEGWAINRLLAAQLARFSTGSTDTTHLVSRGEVPIGIAQPQMNAMVARKDGYPVRDLLPDKTILVPEAVALLKNAPNEAVGKIFLDWLFSMEGQRYVLEGGYFVARKDINFTQWEKEGVVMAKHAKAALGVDNFWDLKVALINYDLDLAAKRWDEVNKYYEFEIYRKWGELKSSLFLIEEVEGEVIAAKAAKMDVTKAEEKIKEARKLFEYDGKYAAARLAATKARSLLVEK
ncbi:MAG: extracellular solute-binding protein [Proteobacteria bacterium]|nr:extracellular solute-binding protein [Pseudomonadota bacterium]MBU4582341.1 extracellular solute-binding protein [Pseudomonadota bacterium]